jgi:hypothetical protein
MASPWLWPKKRSDNVIMSENYKLNLWKVPSIETGKGKAGHGSVVVQYGETGLVTANSDKRERARFIL